MGTLSTSATYGSQVANFVRAQRDGFNRHVCPKFGQSPHIVPAAPRRRAGAGLLQVAKLKPSLFGSAISGAWTRQVAEVESVPARAARRRDFSIPIAARPC